MLRLGVFQVTDIFEGGEAILRLERHCAEMRHICAPRGIFVHNQHTYGHFEL